MRADQDWLTAAEAEQYAKKKRHTLYNWAKKGYIIKYKPQNSKSIFYSAKSIKKYITGE